MNKPKNQRKNATVLDGNWLSYMMVHDIWPVVFASLRFKHYRKMRLVCRLFCGLGSDQTFYDKFHKDAAFEEFSQRVCELGYCGDALSVTQFPYLYPMLLACDFLAIRDLNHLNDVLADAPLLKQITRLSLECKLSRKVMKNGLPSLSKLNAMSLSSGTDFSYKTVQLLRQLTTLQSLSTFVDIVLEHLPRSVTKLDLYMNPPLKHFHGLHDVSFRNVTELSVDGVEPGPLFQFFGNVRALRLFRDSTMHVRDSIGQLTNLRKLDLTTFGGELHQFPDFRQLTTLLHLSIDISMFGPRRAAQDLPKPCIDLKEDLHLDALRSLETLVMNINLDEVAMANVSVNLFSPSLCLLKLKNRRLKIALDEKLSTKFERITVLVLANSNVCDEDLRFVPNVERLFLDECEHIDGSGFRYINRKQQLKLISLQKTKISDDCLEQLAGVQYADLSDTNLNGNGLAYLAGVKIIDLSMTFISCSVAPLSGAHIVNLAQTKITDECLNGLQNVRHLVLDRCRLTEAGFDYLAECQGMQALSASLDNLHPLTDKCLQHFPNLRKLRAYGCVLTDAGLSYVPKIRMLIIQGDGCTVTLDGLKSLRKLNSICRVNWLPDCMNREIEFQAWVKAKKITQMGNLADGFWDFYDIFWDAQNNHLEDI